MSSRATHHQADAFRQEAPEFAQIRGDVLGDPHLGYAMAFGMILVTGLANVVYIVLRMRSERWLK